MKKIVNVGFAPANEMETPHANGVAARMSLSGSNSGSGSGSGNPGLQSASVYGVLSSSFGGKWNAKGSFSYIVDFSYDEDNDVVSIQIRLANVQVFCEAEPSGKQESGCKYYAPISKELLLTEKNFTKRPVNSPADLEFEINFPEEEFRTVIWTYDSNNDGVPKTETELKSPTIHLRFWRRLVYGSLKIKSCVIS